MSDNKTETMSELSKIIMDTAKLDIEIMELALGADIAAEELIADVQSKYDETKAFYKKIKKATVLSELLDNLTEDLK